MKVNREIKFRGLRSDGKGWVYGYYSPVNVPILGTLGHCINEDGYRAIDIDYSSLGQYTGLKDKNGVEIYEGDILQCNSWVGHEQRKPHNNFIDFYSGGTHCGFRVGNGKFRKRLTGNLIYNTAAVIIGNIHQHPELLKGGDNNG